MSVLEDVPERWKLAAGYGGIGFVLGMAATVAYWCAAIGADLEHARPPAAHVRDASTEPFPSALEP